MSINTSLNINAARQDKYSLALGKIPSSVLLSPAEASTFEQAQTVIQDKNYFNLALKTAVLPGVSLGENAIDTTFVTIKETDMKPVFETFVTELKMDEDYIIYKLMVLWIFLIKNPEGYNQYGSGKTYDVTETTGILSLKNAMGDTTLAIELYGLRPISVPTIPLAFTESGEINMEVTWAYDYFMPRKSTGEAYSLILPED